MRISLTKMGVRVGIAARIGLALRSPSKKMHALISGCHIMRISRGIFGLLGRASIFHNGIHRVVRLML